MEKITKKYVEYLMPELAINKSFIQEINHSNPDAIMSLDNEGIMGFRFMEKSFIIYDGKTYEDNGKI